MQRYFIDPSFWNGDDVQIRGDDAAHIAKVMRMEPGDRIIVCDNQGRAAVAELREISPPSVLAQVVEGQVANSEPNCRITLFQALPKGDKLEYIIQKGTEIGVFCFQPVESERAVTQYEPAKITRKLDRWRKIAKEAAEQSHRLRIPQVEAPVSFKKGVEQCAQYDLVIVCYEGEAAAGLRSVLNQAVPGKLSLQDGRTALTAAVWIGPEGGLSAGEVNLLQEQGAAIITLGPRILRTETAGLVSASLLLYHLGEMGG